MVITGLQISGKTAVKKSKKEVSKIKEIDENEGKMRKGESSNDVSPLRAD
jgi:hypothetical protein